MWYDGVKQFIDSAIKLAPYPYCLLKDYLVRFVLMLEIILASIQIYPKFRLIQVVSHCIYKEYLHNMCDNSIVVV